MARNTMINHPAGKMTFGMTIVLRADGSARMTRGTTALERDERSLRLDITVPTKLFETPTLRARIEVPSPDTTPEIDIGAAQAALREALGVDIDIVVQPPQGE